MTAARKLPPAIPDATPEERRLADMIVELLLADIAAHPGELGDAPARLGLRAPIAPEPKRRKGRRP